MVIALFAWISYVKEVVNGNTLAARLRLKRKVAIRESYLRLLALIQYWAWCEKEHQRIMAEVRQKTKRRQPNQAPEPLPVPQEKSQ